MSENRSPGGRRQYATYLIGIGLFVLASIGFTIVNLRGATTNEGLERWRLILGWSLLVWASAFSAFFLISLWAYSSARAISRERPNAILVRSGASPAFKRTLEQSKYLRDMLARQRPPFMQFLLVFDPAGIEIWHGSAMTGSLERSSIRDVTVGRTNDGIWLFSTIDIEVGAGEGPTTISFVVRGPTGYVTARKKDVEQLAQRVRALYAMSASI